MHTVGAEGGSDRNRTFWWLLGGILLLGLFLRWPVPAPAWMHMDEIAFIVLPLGFWSGDLNPHFFNYPTFHFYLNSFLYYLYYLLGSVEPIEEFVAYRFLVDGRDLLAIARGVNVLMAVGAVAVTACLGRHLYGAWGGLLAALLLATMPLAARFSHLAITDTPAVLWVSLALLWAVRAQREGGARTALLAGVFTGLAGATKYPAAMVAAPVAVALLLGSSVLRRSAIWMAAGAAVFTFAVASPFVWLDVAAFWDHFSDMGRSHLLSSSRLEMPAGLYHLFYTLPHGVGVAGSFALALGLLPYPKMWRREELALLVGVFVFGALLSLAGSVFMRYALPLTPFLALLMARSCMSIRNRFLLVAAVAVLVAEPLYASLHTRRLLSGDDTREQAVRWLEEREFEKTHLINLSPEGCGHIQVLTPERVYVRQTHYQRSYGLETLVEAYGSLAQRDNLPPLYLDLDESSARIRQRWTSMAGATARIPTIVLRYRHPTCPESETAPEINDLLEACTWLEHFSPGEIEAVAFDRQDWYFLPIAGLGRMQITGPDIQLGMLSLSGQADGADAQSFFETLHWILRGHEAMAAEDWKRAVQAYARVLQKSAALDDLIGVKLARFVYAQMGRAHGLLRNGREAVHFLERAVALPTAEADIYNELGVAYAASGNMERAVQTWSDAIALYPEYAPAYFNLARGLSRLGKPQRARTYWQRGMALRPDQAQPDGTQSLPK